MNPPVILSFVAGETASSPARSKRGNKMLPGFDDPAYRPIKQGANYGFILFLYIFDKVKYHTINLV